ncbi:uncharacterized protein LOC129938845 isoform X2 [Eupeodes corollae]|uniref:uncharacterized protein LOC129938845 isoform X2 n=1 Tax=Eupeodes corollae TaxID=290404 RepID=UPI00249073C5|nr:uncharacterized protein LOC129938845 isoform X2 [Eupeodes corollae]
MEVDATIPDENVDDDGDYIAAMKLAVSEDEDGGGGGGVGGGGGGDVCDEAGDGEDGGDSSMDAANSTTKTKFENGGSEAAGSSNSNSNSLFNSNKRKLYYDLLQQPETDDLFGFDEETGKPTYGPLEEEPILPEIAEEPDCAVGPPKKSRQSIEESVIKVEEATCASPSPLLTPSTSTATTVVVTPEAVPEAVSPSVTVVPAAPPPTPTATPVPIAVSNKQRLPTDDFYKKPFECGWKRELVYRANPEASKDKADIYFIAPSGKKTRSRNEISALLEGDLTIEHFCFAKEPLGAGPELEIVRSAKPTNRQTAEAVSTPTNTSSGKRISKPKAPKGASPPPQGWTATRALKNSSSLNSNSNSLATGSTVSVSSPKSTPKSSKSRKTNTVETTAENDVNTNDRSKRNNSSSVHRKQHNAVGTSTQAVTTATAAVQSSPPGNSTAQPTNRDSSSLSAAASVTFASNFFANVSVGYGAILHIFKYLKIHERPRAASVCKIWNLVAKDRALWQTVRMKNSKVGNWAGFTAALRRGETKHLDLRKLLVSSTKLEETWSEFCKHIGMVPSLEHIDMCRCSAKVVESIFLTNPNLTILSALAINNESLNLINLDNLVMLRELRLRTLDKCTLEGDLSPLRSLTNLRHLSLTSIRDLGTKRIEVIGELNSLVSLELGDCNDFDSRFTDSVLPKLSNLERLRLEIGQEQCRTLDILDSVAKLENLSQLEFVNFDIKPGFDDKLAQCTNILKLLIIPTYISQSATTNNIVLNAVLKLQDTLEVFTWGVTVELLRVTALYVDQCEDSTRKERHHFDECIPVLKPVPGSSAADTPDNEPSPGANAVPQIEILPLDKVEEILRDNLATTKFTIVKVPYHATWKQQLVE